MYILLYSKSVSIIGVNNELASDNQVTLSFIFLYWSEIYRRHLNLRDKTLRNLVLLLPRAASSPSFALQPEMRRRIARSPVHTTGSLTLHDIVSIGSFIVL